MTEKPQIQCLMNEVFFSISYPIEFSSMNPGMDVCSSALIPWVHPARSESLPCGGPGCINRRDRISGTWFVFKLETTSAFHRLFCSCSPHPDLSMQAIQGRCIHSVSTWGGSSLTKILWLWKKGRFVLGKSLGSRLLWEKQEGLLLYYVFTPSLNKYLWIIYSVPGTVLGADIQIWIKYSSCFQSAHILGRKTNFWKIIMICRSTIYKQV